MCGLDAHSYAPESNGTRGPDPSKSELNDPISLKSGFRSDLDLKSYNHGKLLAENFANAVGASAHYRASWRCSGTKDTHDNARRIPSFSSGGPWYGDKTNEPKIDSRLQHSQFAIPWSQAGAFFNASGIGSDPGLHFCKLRSVECWAGKGLNPEETTVCLLVDEQGLSSTPHWNIQTFKTHANMW